jgi:hypothetical protein
MVSALENTTGSPKLAKTSSHHLSLIFFLPPKQAKSYNSYSFHSSCCGRVALPVVACICRRVPPSFRRHRASTTKVDFLPGGGPNKPVPSRSSESHQGVLSSTEYGTHFRERLVGAPVRALKSRAGSSGDDGGGRSSSLRRSKMERYSAGSSRRSSGSGGGGGGALPGLVVPPPVRGGEPGTSGYLLPSDRAAIIRRTIPANPKPRDAVRRLQPRYSSQEPRTLSPEP